MVDSRKIVNSADIKYKLVSDVRAQPGGQAKEEEEETRGKANQNQT